MPRIPVPDVVVLLPGITGSVLAKDGKEIWSPSAGTLLRTLIGFGRSLRHLEVEDDDWREDDLGDGVTATRLMPDVHLLPGLWKIDGYGEVSRFLLTNFDLERGENFFEFPYDWRRDNRASARKLQRQAEGWLTAWRRRSGNENAQLVLVGHSMGGLVSRYYVECLGGWRHTRAVITFGTPFYGSLNAVEFLVHGYRKKFGPVAFDLSDELRSMRSIHQLVPVYRCVYVDGAAVKPAAAGLPGWKDRWNGALQDFTADVEKAALDNRADEQFHRSPTVYRPIVGTDQPTRQSAVVADGEVRIEWDRGGSDEGGDGTVPTLSAALSGTEDQRTFAPEQHARLQNYDSMLAHLKGVLSTLYQVRVQDLRSQVTSWFSYSAEDVYLPGEPVSVSLAACSSVDEGLLPDVPASLTVTNRETGELAHGSTLRVPRQRTTFEVGPLPPGTYTVQVSGRRQTAPLSDVLVVAGPAETG